MRRFTQITVIGIFGFLMLGSGGVTLPEAFASAVVGNGDVILGVGTEGHLNVRYVGNILDLPASDPIRINWVGLRDGTGTLASTEPGCLCEGWGVWVPNTGGPGTSDDLWGSSGVDSGGVGRNMDVESFNGANGGETAVSSVLIPNSEEPSLRVIHDYHPSAETPYLYEVIVTIENLSEEDFDSVIYRRAMDWDIYPTPFREYVTITGTQTTSQLVNSGDNGFINADPRVQSGFSIRAPVNEDFEDNGPSDHGAMFDFESGPIAAGQSVEIITYYGGAPNEAEALDALRAVGAEIFSLGQSNTQDGATLGTPITFMFGFGNVGGIAFGGDSGNGGMNHWDKRPTFGLSHETRQDQVVENGFSFNGEYFTLTDNHHTDFAEQAVEIGVPNSFSATVYASEVLKVQEFLFGIPTVGESHLAELGVEVWYDRDGNIEDVVVAQDTAVIDEGTVTVSHEKTFCLSTDQEPLCDTTTVSMTFLEPLQDKVMAVKAIDYENRDQRTYLNDGFDISGESLNPMFTKMIPSNMKNQGLIEVTQLAKYSPYWQSENGRMFEMNSFGSFKEINHSFERFDDTGDARTRAHSGFNGILEYEQNRATEVFDSTALISELSDSFGHHYEFDSRLNDQVIQEMYDQAEIASKIIEEMDKQNRHY